MEIFPVFMENLQGIEYGMPLFYGVPISIHYLTNRQVQSLAVPHIELILRTASKEIQNIGRCQESPHLPPIQDHDPAKAIENHCHCIPDPLILCA